MLIFNFSTCWFIQRSFQNLLTPTWSVQEKMFLKENQSWIIISCSIGMSKIYSVPEYDNLGRKELWAHSGVERCGRVSRWDCRTPVQEQMLRTLMISHGVWIPRTMSSIQAEIKEAVRKEGGREQSCGRPFREGILKRTPGSGGRKVSSVVSPWASCEFLSHKHLWAAKSMICFLSHNRRKNFEQCDSHASVSCCLWCWSLSSEIQTALEVWKPGPTSCIS